MVFAWLLGLWRHEEDDALPPPPEPFPKLSEEEREAHRRAIAEREALIRRLTLEARARVKGRWWW